MWTIDPPPASSRCGMANFETRNGPRRLTRRISSNVSTSHSCTGTHVAVSMPALLTSVSSPPSAATAPSTTVRAPSTSDTSPTAATAVPPAATISSTVRCVRSGSRPPTATAAPSRAKRVATSRPIPLDAPVTSARFPSSLIRRIPFDSAERAAATRRRPLVRLLGRDLPVDEGDVGSACTLVRGRADVEQEAEHRGTERPPEELLDVRVRPELVVVEIRPPHEHTGEDRAHAGDRDERDPGDGLLRGRRAVQLGPQVRREHRRDADDAHRDELREHGVHEDLEEPGRVEHRPDEHGRRHQERDQKCEPRAAVPVHARDAL